MAGMAMKNYSLKVEVPDSTELQSEPDVEMYYSNDCSGIVSAHALIND